MTALRDTARDEREAAAFGQVFAELRPSAERYARTLTRDPALAEDIVAEAFARMWPHWSIERIDRPWGYLRRIVLNEVASHHRRAARQARLAPPWTPAATPAADEGVGDRDEVVAMLEHLQPLQRSVLALRYLEDLSERDIATRLDISPGTVKSASSRGLAHLRSLMGPSTRAA